MSRRGTRRRRVIPEKVLDGLRYRRLRRLSVNFRTERRRNQRRWQARRNVLAPELALDEMHCNRKAISSKTAVVVQVSEIPVDAISFK